MQIGSILSLHWLMLGHNAKQNLHEIAGLWSQFVAVAVAGDIAQKFP